MGHQHRKALFFIFALSLTTLHGMDDDPETTETAPMVASAPLSDISPLYNFCMPPYQSIMICCGLCRQLQTHLPEALRAAKDMCAQTCDKCVYCMLTSTPGVDVNADGPPLSHDPMV